MATFIVIALGTLPHSAWASVDTKSQPSAAVEVQSDTAAPKSRPRTRCEFCGVVETIRKMDAVGAEPALYEFTVRLRNGAARVSTVSKDAASAWLVGDAIMLIGGAQSAGAGAVTQLTGRSAAAQ